MNKTVKKIGIILLFIIILPVILLTFNELNTLSDNEKVLEEIYADQLEAVLFSINQYSEDVVSSWATQIDILLENLEHTEKYKSIEAIDSFFNNYPSLVMIMLADSIKDDRLIFLYTSGTSFIYNDMKDELNNEYRNILSGNEKTIRRLFTYKRGNYRKIETMRSDSLNDTEILVFINEAPDRNELRGIILDPQMFINRILSPKIQEVAQDEFVISIFNRESKYEFNSTKDSRVRNIQQERNLWIFPEYKVGITIKGKTIEDVVRERAVTNIVMISLLALILVVGVWIVYRNVKREVELAQIKSDFVSSVSHELRTPLALISMFSETLEMNRVKSDEKRQEYYSIISQEANRLGRIVNTILNFSKMEAGKRKFQFEEKNLNDIVEQMFGNYKFHLKNKNFQFNLSPDKNVPKIKIDEEAVSEAIINLIDNAVKYSDDKKEIKIKTGTDYNFAYVEVSDKGIGISSEDQKKIFDKFFRVSTGLVHNAKGTGLGLTLVKHIMEAHNGKIRLKSRLGEGSTFILLFPIKTNT
jgi:two-component system phosphate regulon sensor histidine kinase PhoR